MGSIEAHWCVDQRVRLITSVGHLDLETVKRYDEDTRRIYDAAQYPIHVIADVRHLKAVPPLSECFKLSTLWHKRRALFVTIGAMRQPMMRLVFTALVKIARLNYRDVSTLEEAQRYLLSCDSSLPPLALWSASPNESKSHSLSRP